MKEEAIAIGGGAGDPARRLNLLREYVQALALRSLHESEAFAGLAFVGGTALRFAFGLPRFSEDLDFSLERQKGYAPERWMKKLKSDLVLSGFEASVSWNDKTTVHKAWLKVAGILKECGLSALPGQKLSIKLEIDTRPPAGAVCVRQVLTRHRLIAVQHHDLSSLMAGKLHALITRGYPKGRDWYDLLWYTGRRPPAEPNIAQLQNALDQTQGEKAFDAADWKSRLTGRLDKMDFRALAADVSPFLEHPDEARLLTTENFRATLAS